MSIANLLSPNNYNIYGDTINDTTNRVNNIWLDNINGAPYNPSPAPIPTLIPNKFLRTTNNVSPSLFWGDVTPGELVHGTANQLLSTNSLGTASEWRSNITIPGTLIVNSSSVFNDNALFNQDCAVSGDSNLNNVDITGNLSFNGSSGSISQVLTKTGATTQNWQSLPTVRLIRFTGFFTAQDLNALAGVSPATFNTVLQQSNLAVSTGSPIVGFSQPSATTFVTGFTGSYDVEFNIYIDPSSSGIGNSIVSISVEIAGVEQPFCICNSSGNYMSGKISSIAISAGSNIRILLRRITGTNQLNIFGFPSVIPNFTSTISFSLVRTI